MLNHLRKKIGIPEEFFYCDGTLVQHDFINNSRSYD